MPKKRIGDIDMYYEITGEGEPLVLIHGLGSSSRDWERQVPFFSKKYQVITLDIRGHGKTDKPKGPYSVPMFAKDVVELLKLLNIGPVHLVGISLGGAIALQFTINYPEMIKSLVVVNSRAGKVVTVNILKRTLIVKLRGMKKMGEVLAPILFIKPEQEEYRKKLIERWAENDSRAYLTALRTLKGWNVLNHLHTIKCPTLVIGSDEDYTPTSVKEAYTALIQNAKLIVFPRIYILGIRTVRNVVDRGKLFFRDLPEHLPQYYLKTTNKSRTSNEPGSSRRSSFF